MMGSKSKRMVVFITAIALLTGIQFAYAGSDLSWYQGSAQAASPGDKDVSLEVFVTNKGPDPFVFDSVTLSFGDNVVSANIRSNHEDGGTIQGDAAPYSIRFTVDVRSSAPTGIHTFQLVFKQGANEIRPTPVGTPGYLFITDESLEIPIPEPPSEPRTYRPAVDFSHSLGAADGLSPGKGNTISFFALNRGDTPIRNAEFTIVLPEGMSITNASTTSFVGTISIGQRVGRTFSITVYDDLAGGRSYPITIKVTGIDRGNSPVSLENIFYIPVKGTGAGAIKDIAIENIAIPKEVSVDEDFALEFSVRNTGTSSVKNIKAYAEMPTGIINKTNAVFVIDSIGAGETQAFSVTMSARERSGNSFPIKIAVEPLSGGTGETIRYASVFVKGGSAGDAKTPQLIVDRYSYGGSSVLAGKEFTLELGLYNTSNKDLSNIKVTIISDDGTFVPVDSSNSFFVERIGAGGHHTRPLILAAKPSAEQKTTGITVRMSYEDGEGGSFNADDTISIPVMQVMRLSVDEIIPPYECYVGMMGYSSLQFYNLGKTTLNNLMINAEGNFDVMESNSYYVGNMEGGNSDRYSFTFMPREAGPMEGKVIFTYENIDGDVLVHEVPFTFQVMEMPVWDDPYPWQEPKQQIPWAIIIFGAVLVVAATGFVVWRKLRKSKLNKKLEIQDEQF